MEFNQKQLKILFNSLITLKCIHFYDDYGDLLKPVKQPTIKDVDDLLKIIDQKIK